MGTNRANETPESPVPTGPESILLRTALGEREMRCDPRFRQKALVALGRRAVVPPDLSILIQDAISILSQTLNAELILMAELAADGRNLACRLTQLGGSDGNPQTWTSNPSASGNDSLTAYTMQTSRPVVVVDLARENRFSDQMLRNHGVQSAVASPLNAQNVAFGVLAACSDLPAHFDDEDMLFVESAAHLIATSITRVKAEKSLAEERRISQGLLLKVEAMVVILDDRGRILRINAACEQTSEFKFAAIPGRRFAEVFGKPEDARLIDSALQKASEGLPAKFECMLFTRSGNMRKIAWNVNALGGDRGGTIIASGVDVTRKRELERQVESQRTAEADAAARLAAAAAFPVERRRRARRAYPFRQRLGYVFDGKMPDKSEFIDILCHDIGVGGISYLSETPPLSGQLVVALGLLPKITCVTADVVHCRRVEHEGSQVYLIGCKYTGRAIF